jgi:hypothetical protein
MVVSLQRSGSGGAASSKAFSSSTIKRDKSIKLRWKS